MSAGVILYVYEYSSIYIYIYISISPYIYIYMYVYRFVSSVFLVCCCLLLYKPEAVVKGGTVDGFSSVIQCLRMHVTGPAPDANDLYSPLKQTKQTVQ